MPTDTRNVLDVLKFELEFLRQGGYGRLPREAWRARFVFEDSPTCMNFNSKDHAPCSECLKQQIEAFFPRQSSHGQQVGTGAVPRRWGVPRGQNSLEIDGIRQHYDLFTANSCLARQIFGHGA